MFDGFSMIGQSALELFTIESIIHVSWATLLGIFIGSLPGLTATMGVALLTTLTYGLDQQTAILVLICMYVGAIYGGSRSAILLNIPGTPASAATALDGFPLAKQGKARYAMTLATSGSALGTLVGLVILAVMAPVLAEFALKFGSFEFFWLALFGIIVSGQLTSGGVPVKGYIAGILGLMASTVGSEGIHSYVRFSFGIHDLGGGIALIPAMVGAFGFAELITVMMNSRTVLSKVPETKGLLPKMADLWRYKRTIFRSGIIGTLVGIIPGVGEDIGAWSSYAAAKRASRNKDEYGKGSQEGLIAAETGNSAVVPGALIPALTLGIPGSAPAAVLIAALFIHGIRPGPMIMIEQPTFVYAVVVMLFMAMVAITVYGLALTKLFVMVLSVPRERLMPVVFVLCVIGPFALTQRVFDIWVMIAFGIIGYVLRRMDYPMAPLVLGIILGNLLDKNLRRGLILSDGDIMPFLTRPISATFMVMTVLTILLGFPSVRRRLALVVSKIIPSYSSGKNEA